MEKYEIVSVFEKLGNQGLYEILSKSIDNVATILELKYIELSRLARIGFEPCPVHALSYKILTHFR